EQSQPDKYIVALQVCGWILFGLGDYSEARDSYRVALRIADEQNDAREYAKALNNVGQCNICLGNYDVGERQLREAARRMYRERMESEMLRTVAALANAASRQGRFEEALDAFHSVYADFLENSMFVPAAQVLVEIAFVVTEISNDVTYAREQCAHLAANLGNYDLPGNVRDAVNYVQRQTSAPESVAQVRTALLYVRAFLTTPRSSPSLAFVAPA
ncbi:MAG TPA: tetratricopeptide repeat protein, partial [Thermoanaerobaculia bacterium]|nr:tetratricopeptide repeat protein [Thermoanaerobaculia bacterium]